MDPGLAARLLEAERKVAEEQEALRRLFERGERAAQAGWAVMGSAAVASSNARRGGTKVGGVEVLGCLGLPREAGLLVELWTPFFGAFLGSLETNDDGIAPFAVNPADYYGIKVAAAGRYAAREDAQRLFTFDGERYRCLVNTYGAMPYVTTYACSRPQRLGDATATIGGTAYTLSSGRALVDATASCQHYKVYADTGHIEPIGAGTGAGAIGLFVSTSTGYDAHLVTLEWYKLQHGDDVYPLAAKASDGTLPGAPSGHPGSVLTAMQANVGGTITACDPAVLVADFTGTLAHSVLGITTVTIEAPPD